MEEVATECWGGSSRKNGLQLFILFEHLTQSCYYKYCTTFGQISSADFWSASFLFNIQASQQNILIITSVMLVVLPSCQAMHLLLLTGDTWQSEPTI